MDARAYLPTDLGACVALLERRGHGERRESFEQAVAASGTRFFVLEHDGVLLGCGGIRAGGPAGEAELVWGMVDPAWERQGLGRFLLLYRSKLCGAPFLAVTVPPEFAGFYEKAGFRRTNEANRLVKKMEVCP